MGAGGGRAEGGELPGVEEEALGGALLEEVVGEEEGRLAGDRVDVLRQVVQEVQEPGAGPPVRSSGGNAGDHEGCCTGGR